MKLSPSVLLPLSLLWLAPLRPAAAQTYTITDLGTLPGGTFSQAAAINNLGHITGIADTDQPYLNLLAYEGKPSAGRNRLNFVARAGHVFFWDDHGMHDWGGDTMLESAGNAINDYDEVSGTNSDSCGVVVGLFGRRNKKSAMLRGYGAGFAINNKGEAAGDEHDFDLMFGRHPFADQQHLSTARPPGGGDPPTEDAEATGINDVGLVVGSADVSAKPGTKPHHAVLWRKGIRRDLGTLGGTESRALAVNTPGQIVGISSIAQAAADGNPLYHAFFWNAGKMTDLGTLPGDKQSGANALNSRGEVVGYSGERGCLWRGGKAQDLNALLPAGSGWVLQGAAGINNRGQIVGTGLHRGKKRGYLLTPKR